MEYLNGTKQSQELRKHFNIEKIKNVKITKVNNAPYHMYLVVLDSRSPNFPITTASVLRAIPRNFLYANGRSTPLLPFVDLDKFNGSLTSNMFVLIDLAGQLRDRNKYTEDTERLTELTVLDLKDLSAMSPLTTIFYNERVGWAVPDKNGKKRKIFGGNKAIKIIGCNIRNVGSDDYAEWEFLTEVTPKDDKKKQTKVDKGFELTDNPLELYELYIRIPDFFKWLDTRPDKDKKITREELQEILDNVDAQVFCTCPAQHWQGLNYNLTQLDASIYPTRIAPTVRVTSKGKEIGWKNKQKHGLICKHLGSLFRHISFFEQIMLSMLNKKLKEKQIIKEDLMVVKEEDKEEVLNEEGVASSGVVQSETFDNGMVKPLKKDNDDEFKEGMLNIAVAIDKHYGMEDDVNSQYYAEIKNEKQQDILDDKYGALKEALHLDKSSILRRFLKEDKGLEAYTPMYEAIKIGDTKLTEDIFSHISKRLLAEVAMTYKVAPTDALYEAIYIASKNQGLDNFSVDGILSDLVSQGDI